jgi:hypothetical protein
MRPLCIQVHSLSLKSTPFLLSPWESTQFAGAGRAGSGAAPHTVKDAFGATRGPLRASLTGGTLRPLTPAHVGRPVACPPLRPPRPRPLPARADGRSRAVGRVEPGRDFTRTDAPPQPSDEGLRALVGAGRRARTAVRSSGSAARPVGWCSR